LRSSRSLQLWLQQIKQLSKLPHVVCKLSGLVTETDWQSGPLGAIERDNMTRCFDEVLDAFGPNRILFGSDWPVCTLAADYAAVSHFAREWAERQLSAAEQTRFWSGNATAVYNLSPAPTAVGNDSRH
jgi:L-fuconolactonase